ncbi:MAG: hypothetical protein OEU36_18340, partial [Gammaproteobacteria bacterium]|nr:hypothetical protein [Gammaproteobacteria bacterium]
SGRLADADSATTVDNNYFFRADGDPEIISNKSSGNVYRHNTFVESQGALTLRQGHRVTIDGNYFFGGGVALTSGVTILGDSHTIINNYFFNLNPTNYHRLGGIVMGTADDKIDPQKGWYDLPRVRNVLIAHNTILGTEQSLLYKESRDNGFGNVKPTGVRIINNIISAPGKDLIEDRINLADVEYAGNVFDGNVDSAVSSGGNITRNPRLQESGDSVFRPGSDSPAIDAAVELSTVTHDIDDQRRRGSSDIGADEFSNGGSMRAPIGLCDVGPTSFRPGLKAACTNTATRPAPPQFLTIS